MHRETFERLWEEHARGLLGFLVYRTQDPALAEDLVSETFERVLRSRRPFDPRKGSEKTWIYSIALNRMRDHQRRLLSEERALERVQTPPNLGRSPGESEVEARDVVSRALKTLSEEEYEVVALRYGGELTLPEIAALQGEKLSTIRGRLYGSLRKLRDELGPGLG